MAGSSITSMIVLFLISIGLLLGGQTIIEWVGHPYTNQSALTLGLILLTLGGLMLFTVIYKAIYGGASSLLGSRKKKQE